MRFIEPLRTNTTEWVVFRENIKSQQCPHCGCSHTVRSHGSLYGVGVQKDNVVRRGARFYCSNRYSNKGCGHTFSVHFNTVIPYHSVRSFHIVLLLVLFLTGGALHRAWHNSSIPFTFQSALHWFKKFKLNLPKSGHRLHDLIRRKIEYSNQSIEIETVNLLKNAFSEPDFVAQFQQQFQLPFFHTAEFIS